MATIVYNRVQDVQVHKHFNIDLIYVLVEQYIFRTGGTGKPEAGQGPFVFSIFGADISITFCFLRRQDISF